jgi:hypothetical protein
MNPKLKIVIHQRSGERAELSAAIEHVAAADNTLEAVRAAVKRANEMVSAASEQLDVARAEVATAKEAQTSRLVASASSGEALAPDTTLRAARMRELEAADDLDAARSALGLLEARLDDPEHDHHRAKDRLDRTVEAVFVGDVDRLLAEALAAQALVAEKRAVLQAIVANIDHFRQLETRKKIESFFFDCSFTLQHQYDAWKSHPATKPWIDARDALSRDADAELPK